MENILLEAEGQGTLGAVEINSLKEIVENVLTFEQVSMLLDVNRETVSNAKDFTQCYVKGLYHYCVLEDLTIGKEESEYIMNEFKKDEFLDENQIAFLELLYDDDYIYESKEFENYVEQVITEVTTLN